MRPKSQNIELYLNDLSEVYEGFFRTTGLKYSLTNISKEHLFYQALSYYVNNRNNLTKAVLIQLGRQYYETTNHLLNLYRLKPAIVKKGEIKLFLQKGMIHSICVEAFTMSEYLMRGYGVVWLTPTGDDPPDFIVVDPINKVNVNFEVKCKIFKADIESMFKAFSSGARDLKKSEKLGANPSVVVVHNPEDLGWDKWLQSTEVEQNLISRLRDKWYHTISGVIFSGGSDVRVEGGEYQRGFKNVAFRFDSAKYLLPHGFLNKSGKI